MLLRVADIARLTRRCPATVKLWVATWEAQPRNPAVPAVTRVSAGGRPGFRVDADEFLRWLDGADVVREIPALPTAEAA